MTLDDRLDVKVLIPETDVGGTIEVNFDEDGVFGPDPDGLICPELEEPVAKAKGEVVGDYTRDAQREDLLKLLCG